MPIHRIRSHWSARAEVDVSQIAWVAIPLLPFAPALAIQSGIRPFLLAAADPPRTAWAARCASLTFRHSPEDTEAVAPSSPEPIAPAPACADLLFRGPSV